MGKLDFLAEKWEKRISESDNSFLQKVSSLLEKEKDPFVADFVRVTALYLDPIANFAFGSFAEACAYDPWSNVRDCFRAEIVNNEVRDDPMAWFHLLSFAASEMGNGTNLNTMADYVMPLEKFHTSEYLLDFKDLFDIGTDEIRSNIGRIVKLHDQMASFYLTSHEFYPVLLKKYPELIKGQGSYDFKDVHPDQAQAEFIGEVIILGKLNCLPCYSENFRRGLRECGITDHFCKDSMLELCDFFDSKLACYYGEKCMNVFNISSQSVMKFLHTGFSEIGKAFRQQETEDPAETAGEKVSG